MSNNHSTNPETEKTAAPKQYSSNLEKKGQLLMSNTVLILKKKQATFLAYSRTCY